MTKFGMGQPVRRVEDPRLLTGQGRFTDDLSAPGQVHLVILRSPYGAALIKGTEVAAARAMPGVLGAWAGAELRRLGLGGVPCLASVPDRRGGRSVRPDRPVVALDRVQHLGEAVALVVAETLAQARDAAEQIAIDYETLPAVVDGTAALAPGAPQVHPQVPGNLLADYVMGEPERVAEAFAGAAHVTRMRIVNNRIVVAAMEPRACLARYDAADGRFTLDMGGQGVHIMRDSLAGPALGIEPAALRVVARDVGGGFGMKLFAYPEYAAALWAARAVGRPVRWCAERGESFVSDSQGRDQVTEAALGFDRDGRILGLEVSTIANMGGQVSGYGPGVPTIAGSPLLPGVYDIPMWSLRVRCVMTNTLPVDAYRGAGRPEAAYVIERLVDRAARELGLDPADLRRRNMVQPGQLPYRTCSGLTYDSGDFARVQDEALARADRAGFAARRADSMARGRRRGLGHAVYIERTGGNPKEHARILVDPVARQVVARVGTLANGQGHETAFGQVIADRLGIAFEQVRIVIGGDSDELEASGGTAGSRSLLLGGGAVVGAAEAAIDAGKPLAAELLEAAAVDIEYGDGAFRIAGTDRSIDLFAVAARAADQLGGAGLVVNALFEHGAPTYPNGCHVCEVEVDPETGVIAVARYTVVDDFGRLVNPMLVEGQVHGGIAQGLGQALTERVVYDDDGQLLTGSFMDYGMPRADLLPPIAFSTIEVPCQTNFMGIKGAGEAGAIGAPPALVNAVLDALAADGVADIDMPLTPERVWRAIREARAG